MYSGRAMRLRLLRHPDSRMPRRFTAGSAICAAVLVIAGCASSSAGSQGSGSGSAGSGSKAPFKIGVTNALTGPYAALGTGMKAGFDAAIAAANKSGGAAGHQIDVTYLDDADNQATSLSNDTTLGSQ